MKKALIFGLLLALVGCNETWTKVSITQDIVKRTPSAITFTERIRASVCIWNIIKSSDGHDYLENDGYKDYIIMHYVECGKCKKK